MWFDGVVPDSEEPRDAPRSNQADSIWSTDDVPVPAEPLDTVWSAHETGTDDAVSLAPLRQTFDEPAEPEFAGASHPRTLRSKLLVGAGLLVTLAVVVTVVIRSTGEEGSAPGTTVSETKASTTTTVPTTTDAPRNESSAAGLGDGVAAAATTRIELPPAVAAIQSPTEVVMLTADGTVRTLSLPSGRVRSTTMIGDDEMFGSGGPIVVAPQGSAISQPDGNGLVIVPRTGPNVSVGADELSADARNGFQVVRWWRAGDGTERFVLEAYSVDNGNTTFASVGLRGDVVPLVAPQAVASGFGLTTPDGTWIVNDAGGAYEVDAAGASRRIASGTVLAAARDHTLVRECDESLQCSTVLVRRSDGERRIIDPALLPVEFDSMVYSLSMSHDGSALSAIRTRVGQQERVIIDLDVGEVVAARTSSWQQGSTWAADSSGIFDARTDGPGLQFIARTGETVEFGEELGQVITLGVRWPDAELQPTVTVVSESVSAARPIGPTGITLIGAMPGGGMSYIDIDAGVAQSWATSERLGGDLTLIKSADALLAFGTTDDPAFAFRKGVQEPLDALFATMGVKLPGPVDGTIWIPAPELGASRSGVGYRLVTIDGLPVDDGGATIDVPGGELLGSDGRGGLVVRRAGDVFAVGIDGVVRLTTGELIAVGADTVYVRECATIDVCEIARVDRRTGDRSTVDAGFGPDAPLADPWPPGVGLGTSVSPDGDVALMQIPVGSTDPAGGTDVVETWAFVDTAGRKLTFIDDFDAGQPVVWSADSRFATVLADSNLYVFDREAGDLVPLSTQRFRAIGSAASAFPPGTAD